MKERKVIFAGLDFGGKTSIILTLQRKFSCMDAKPTRGIARSNLNSTKFLGFEFTTWDLGGQRKFREDYMKKKYRVFTNTGHLFYVIDMQDSERFDESLDYLKDIVHTFEVLKETPKIIILLHKIDPDILPSCNPEMIKLIEEVKTGVQNLEIPYEVKFFNTSIHDRATIITAFSKSILKGEGKAQLIKSRLKEYAKNTFSSAVLLLSSDYLEMASHYSKKEYLKVCESVAPHFIDAMSRISDYNLTPTNTTVDLIIDSIDSEENNEAVIFVKTFVVNEYVFHIISMSRNKRTLKLSEEHLPILSVHLANLLHQIDY